MVSGRIARSFFNVGGLLLLATLFPAAVYATDIAAFIPAKWLATEPALDPMNRSWLNQPATTVSVYPQTSVPPAAAPAGAATIKVRARYSAKMIALHLEWADDKPAKDRGVGQFADGAAVQWPVRYGPGAVLPYIGMGHDGAPVALWFWRGDGSVETLAAAGFGTLTAQVPDGVKARGIWKDGKWHVVFTRPLAAAGEQRVTLAPAKLGLVPVAFATWNGEAAERNGLKRLSAWQVLRFEKGKPDAAYAKQLGEVAVAGDAERGKRLMSEKGCVACHSFPGNPAQPRIGPGLSYAGGIHSGAYLRESLTQPSNVIVPGKGYFLAQEGKKVSLMPPLVGADAERDDILAYLMSLR
jgi:complex iron-sulfur molybdoenzyme family reductase subunit gamma